MRPLDAEGVTLLREFERDYETTKRALLEGEQRGFSQDQTPRQDLIVLGERLRAVGAGFRRSRRNNYNKVVVDGKLRASNPFGPR